MRKVIAVCGVPGTGKSTLFREFMKSSTWERTQPAKLVDSEYSKDLDLYILGKYDEGETFPGTDKLSLAVQPEFVKWFKVTESNILMEGDRLTNMNLYELMSEQPDIEFHIVVLKCKQDLLKQRYADRGSNQSDQFLNGRETKISNIQNNFSLAEYITEFKNETKEEQSKILDFINSILSEK
jgi:broad-specificity NMP kinase